MREAGVRVRACPAPARRRPRRSVPEAARTKETSCPCPPRIPSSWSSTPTATSPGGGPWCSGPLATPHLLIAYALRFVRQALTLISFFTVLFTEQIPRPLFDAIVMTYRYEWRAMSYAFFMHQDYPPFDFDLSTEDDGAEPHTSLRLTYPGHLQRWQPLYKWFLAIPQYFVLAGLAIAACAAIIAGFFAVLFTGDYPEGIQGFLVSAYRYALRVEAYVGFLTDRYPPFSLAA